MGRSGIVLAIILIGCVFATSIAKKRSNKLETVIGIDLGARYSCVGVYKNDHGEIIANDQGNRITPSWVAFTDSERLIGEAAKNQAAVNAERTIFDVKRLIGRKSEDEEVQRYMKLVPYKIVNQDGKPYIQVKIKDGETKVFSPGEISTMILTKMKETAEAFLGKKVKDADVTVPAYFNDAQKQATKDAAAIAGLNVARIISKPMAAAIAYDLHKGGERNILVFDLGGGTFDVSIMTVDNGFFEVIATNEDAHLGGEDFDQKIMEYFIKLIKNKHGKDISKDNKALGKLRREAERAKRALSSQDQVHVQIESLFDNVDFSEPLTRAQFEELNNNLLEKTMGHVKKAMEDAGLDKHQIDEIVLVGEGTMIPKVQQLLKDYFDGKEPNKGVNPDEVVAFGAAVQGGILSGEVGGESETADLCGTRCDALKALETYVNDMKKQVNDKDKLADKLESDEKERIESAMKEALEWLVNNQLAERDEYYEKLEEVKAVCNPIITAVYQRSGGAPGGAAEDYNDEHDGRRWIVLISCLVSILLGYYLMK